MVLLSEHFVFVSWHSQTGAVGGGGTWEIKAVAAHSDADTVYLDLDGLNGGNHSGIGDFAVIGNG